MPDTKLQDKTIEDAFFCGYILNMQHYDALCIKTVYLKSGNTVQHNISSLSAMVPNRKMNKKSQSRGSNLLSQ